LRLYATTPLENATVTGDTLNNNKQRAQAVIDAGGDYFFQLKNENRHAYKAASRKTQAPPFCSYAEEPDANHGRIDQRQISVYLFEPVEARLPGARALVVIERTSNIDGEEKTQPPFALPVIRQNRMATVHLANWLTGTGAGAKAAITG
jgi:hypothetical protein